jgi:hypothetical protein
MPHGTQVKRVVLLAAIKAVMAQDLQNITQYRYKHVKPNPMCYLNKGFKTLEAAFIILQRAKRHKHTCVNCCNLHGWTVTSASEAPVC